MGISVTPFLFIRKPVGANQVCTQDLRIQSQLCLPLDQGDEFFQAKKFCMQFYMVGDVEPLLEGNELEINQGGIVLRATISKFVIEKVVKNTLQKRYKSPDLYSFVLRSSKVLLELYSIVSCFLFLKQFTN